jgi:hypothetical protein
MAQKLDEFTRAYIATALWSSTDNTDEQGGESLDRNYGPEDIEPDTLTRMIADCAKFQGENRATIDAAIATGGVRYGPDYGPDGRAGHDFWLTRNGHGCGFWDGDWPEPYAEQLTDAAQAYPQVDLSVEGGRIYAD